jgi:hypothetical protein
MWHIWGVQVEAAQEHARQAKNIEEGEEGFSPGKLALRVFPGLD